MQNEINETNDVNGQTVMVFFQKSKIRLTWHESKEGLVNWSLEFLRDSSTDSAIKNKIDYSFIFDGSTKNEKGWLYGPDSYNANSLICVCS